MLNILQAESVGGLVDLISYFPSHIRFFVNVWTWGYEDILKAIAEVFDSKVGKSQQIWKFYQETDIIDLDSRRSLQVWSLFQP